MSRENFKIIEYRLTQFRSAIDLFLRKVGDPSIDEGQYQEIKSALENITTIIYQLLHEYFHTLSDSDKKKVSEMITRILWDWNEFPFDVLSAHNKLPFKGVSEYLRDFSTYAGFHKGAANTNEKKRDKAAARQSLIKTFLTENPNPDLGPYSLETFLIEKLKLEVSEKTIKGDLHKINLETR